MITGYTFAAGEVVTPDKLNALVGDAELESGEVTEAKIADANVTTAKIADANVTTAKIADRCITAEKLNGHQVGGLPLYAVRAYCQFFPPDTLSLSGHVSSVSKLTTGTFLVNFSSALPSANYVILLSSQHISGFGNGIVCYLNKTTTSFTIVATYNGTLNDLGDISACVLF